MVKEPAENLILDRRLVYLPAALFFASIFLAFYPPAETGDIWIHMNQGKWLWEHGSFPPVDTFAYTTTPENADRVAYLYRGYWLSQIIFYAVYKVFGFAGLSLFSAALFTLIFAVLWRILCRQGLDPLLALVVVAPCVLIGRYYNELRPRNFMFLLLLLLYAVLEKGLAGLRSQNARWYRTPLFLLLPVLVLLWANLYRGFIVVAALFTAYLAGEMIARHRTERPAEIVPILSWFLLAFLASLATPNFLRSFTMGIGELTATYAQAPIMELSRPWDYAFITSGNKAFFPLLVLTAAAAAIILATAWRRVEYSHALLFASFALAGGLAFRFSFLFTLIAAVISGRYIALPSVHLRTARIVAAALSVLFSAYLLLTSPTATRDETRKPFFDSTVLPVAAVDYLLRERPPQPLFNPYGWGGYISWRAAPEYRVFIDSSLFDASLSAEEVYAEQHGAIHVLLDKYRIRTAIYYLVNRGQVSWTTLGLLRADDWGLVYYDRTAAVFVRIGSMPNANFLDKQRLYDYLTLFAQMQIQADPAGNDGYANLAAVYRSQGRRNESDEVLRLGASKTGHAIR